MILPLPPHVPSSFLTPAERRRLAPDLERWRGKSATELLDLLPDQAARTVAHDIAPGLAEGYPGHNYVFVGTEEAVTRTMLLAGRCLEMHGREMGYPRVLTAYVDARKHKTFASAGRRAHEGLSKAARLGLRAPKTGWSGRRYLDDVLSHLPKRRASIVVMLDGITTAAVREDVVAPFLWLPEFAASGYQVNDFDRPRVALFLGGLMPGTFDDPAAESRYLPTVVRAYPTTVRGTDTPAVRHARPHASGATH